MFEDSKPHRSPQVYYQSALVDLSARGQGPTGAFPYSFHGLETKLALALLAKTSCFSVGTQISLVAPICSKRSATSLNGLLQLTIGWFDD